MPNALLSLLLLGALTFSNGGILAAQTLVIQVIELRYRSLEEILPVLQPLVPAPGSVTGLSNRLVVKTSPENLQEIEGVLVALDRPPRRLMITVRQGRQEDGNTLQGEVAGTYQGGDVTLRSGRSSPARSPGLVLSHEGDESRGEVRVLSTRRRDEGSAEQRIQVLEGREAFIQSGQSVPVAERQVFHYGGVFGRQDSIRYQEVTTGFYVVPRINGDMVQLDIRPHFAALRPGGGGSIDVQEARTTVTGRLGEWLAIAATHQQQRQGGQGTTYITRSREQTGHQVFLKVEEMNP
jgi:hypothetical protein